MGKDKLEAKVIINEGSIYGLSYFFECRGSAVMATIPVTDELKKQFIEQAVRSACAKVSSEMARDLVKEFRKQTAKQINKAVREHFVQNKDKFLKSMIKQATRDAEAKLKEVRDYYDD